MVLLLTLMSTDIMSSSKDETLLSFSIGGFMLCGPNSDDDVQMPQNGHGGH